MALDLTFINTTLQSVAKLINQVRNVTNFYNTKSLSEVTKLTRVEPLTIISRQCLNLDYMQDINATLLNIFAGYYLQAVSMLTKVNDVEVIRILDKLNPDRDETGFLLSEEVSRESLKTLSLENYQFALPTKHRIAIEADDKPENVKLLNEVSSLSVGKMLNVEIMYSNDAGEEPKCVNIQVNVRLLVSVIPTPTISHIIAHKTEDNSLTERWHAWRSGRISFIKDLIFCQDLIDEHKKAMVGDDSGTMFEIMRRVNNAKKFGLLTKNPSLVSASNIFVITADEARDIEQKLGGKLSNSKIREKAFENTYAMILTVIDREYERVTFYTRGVAAAADFSIKEVKAAAKGKGPDIADIMKQFQMGAPLTF